MAKRSKKKVSLPKVKALKHEAVLVPANENAPTLERLAQAGHVVATHLGTRRTEIVGSRAESPFGADGVARIAQSPLDRLQARRQLAPEDPGRNRDLFDAGDRFRTHWYRAGLSGIGSIDLNRAGGGGGDPAWLMPSSEAAAYHREKHRAARAALDPDSFAAVLAVCCGEDDLGMVGRQAGFGNDAGATAVALDRLRRGLAKLAEMYGIIPPRPVNENRLDHCGLQACA